MKNGKWLVGLTALATALAGTHAAFAQAGSDSPGGSAAGAPQPEGQPAAAPAAEGEPKEDTKPADAPSAEPKASTTADVHADSAAPTPEAPAETPPAEREPKLELGLDMMLGFGKVPFAAAEQPGSLQTFSTYHPASVTSQTEAFILGGAYHIKPQFAVGVRLPFTFGAFDPTHGQSSLGGRSTVALGNVEIEARYEAKFSAQMKLVAALDVTLPTAQGADALPDEATLEQMSNTGRFDRNSFDRFSTNRAAALSRGYEENSLYFADRLGINPRLALEYKSGPLTLVPSVKLNDLIATSSSLEHSYLGEVIPGLRAGYRFHKFVEGGVRVWANVAFSGSSDLDKVAAAVEPQVIGHFGPVTPVVGVVLPFVGAPVDPMNVGVRIALSATF